MLRSGRIQGRGDSLDHYWDLTKTPPKEPLTKAVVDALANQTRLLLVASEVGDGFSKHYFDALQRDPDVVLAHAEVARFLRPRKGPV